MSTLKSNTLLAASLIVAGLSAPMLSHAQSTGGDYWGNAPRDITVKSGFGLCWRPGYSQSAGDCAAPVAAQPAPAVAQAPAPAPVAAPVAAPAAAPAPVAAPAPAPVAAPAPAPQPAEAWKTTVTEKPVRLEGASFAAGSSKLLPGAAPKLDEVVKAAKEHPEIELNVSGYTDNTGNAQGNVKLSQARAEAVKAYLVKHGVAANRVSAKGFGPENPIADNATLAGRSKNRRVEVRYVTKEETKVRVSP